MKYISTRGAMPPMTFSDALLEGLSRDGGLMVPDQYPSIDWRNLPISYADVAAYILSTLAPDIPLEDWHTITQDVYHTDRFVSCSADTSETNAITPLTLLSDDLALLELSNGPTLAFKDIALQLLGALFSYQLKQTGSHLNILGATSGDTGSSAEYAMRGRDAIQVFMLSPKGRMSAFQQAQMYSLMDQNIVNLAVDGVFDQCQSIVKTLGEDILFKTSFNLGTVNSINWARIAAQTVYYFYGYRAAWQAGFRNISFVIPSGNFGNVYAGHVARCMGLPIHRLIVATNENNVLEECIRTGIYQPRAGEAVLATSSPSMDIARASNFERYVFDLCGRMPDRHNACWQYLNDEGKIDFKQEGLWEAITNFSQNPHTALASGFSTHQDRLSCIRQTWQRYHRLIDPHTADGFSVGCRLQESDEQLIVLETAQPLKFADCIQEAIGLSFGDPQLPYPSHLNYLHDLLQRSQRYMNIEANADAVRTYIQEYFKMSSSSDPYRDKVG